MKKILLLLLVLVLSFSLLVACGPTEDPTPTPGDCTEHVDADNNGKCDKCDAEMPKPECTEHVDEDEDGKCDNCDTDMPEPECTEHVDADKSGTCDNCGAALVDQALLDAAAYIRQMYKDDPEVTLDDYELVGSYGDFTVTWSVNVSEEFVKVVIKDDGKVLIDVTDEELLEDAPYVLTATVSNDKGESVVKTFNHKVPKFEVTSFEDYMAAKNGDNVIVQGIVVAINSKSKGNTRNHLFLMDLNTVGGYYSYQMDQDPLTDLGIEIGMTVRVSGPASPYSGMQEIKGGTAKIVDPTIKTFEYIDITDEFSKENPNFANYVALPVVIKGVTIGGQELGGTSEYLFFELNGIKSYIRTYVTDFPTTLVKADKATIDAAHAAKYGYTADVEGVLVLFNGNPYLIPTSVDCFYNYVLPERTDAEKAQVELDALTLPSKLTADQIIDLVLAGKTYDNVTIVWTTDDETGAAVIADGKLTLTVPDEKVTVKVTATATCGEATATKKFEIELSKTIMTLADAEAEAKKAGSSYTTGKYLIAGIITEIAQDYYGNVYIKDETGKTFYVYGILDADGNKYGDLDSKPAVGDYVVLLGILGTYKDDPQMKNAELVEFKSNTSIPDANATGKANPNYDTGKYLVTGTITEIANSTYGNVYITDAEGNKLYVYGLYSSNGAVRFDKLPTQPKVGDTITVFGVLGAYKDAPQMKDAWLVAHEVNGDTPVDPDDPTDVPGVVGTPAVDTAYKFGMLQGNLNKMFYLKGGMDGYYMATTENYAEALDVYLETTAGGYYLYCYVGGAKTYINMIVSGTHVNGAYEATASTVYTFDTEAKIIVATVNDALYAFGTRNDNTYTTIGPVAVSYNGFHAGFYSGETTPDTPVDPNPDHPDTPDTTTTSIADIIAAANGKFQAAGTVVGVNAQSFLLYDGTGIMLVYKGSKWTPDVAIGDQVTVNGNTTVYGCAKQFGQDATYEKTGSTSFTQPTASKLTAAELDAYATATTVTPIYVTVTGTLSVSGNYFNIAIDGATITGSFTYPLANDKTALTALDGKMITVTGYITGTTSGGKYLSILATDFAEYVAISVEGSYVGTDSQGNELLSVEVTANTVVFTYNDPVNGATVNTVTYKIVDGAVVLYGDDGKPLSPLVAKLNVVNGVLTSASYKGTTYTLAVAGDGDDTDAPSIVGTYTGTSMVGSITITVGATTFEIEGMYGQSASYTYAIIDGALVLYKEDGSTPFPLECAVTLTDGVLTSVSFGGWDYEIGNGGSEGDGDGDGSYEIIPGATILEPVESVGNVTVTVTDNFGWFDLYGFKAPVANTYTFTVPSGAGVISKYALENRGDPYVDYQMDNGGVFSIELEAGEIFYFYVASIQKGDVVLTYNNEAYVPVEPIYLQVGENIVTITEADLVDGIDTQLYVGESGTYTFSSNDLLAIVFDANGMMIGRGMAYLESSWEPYTVKLAPMTEVAGEYTVDVQFTGVQGSESNPYEATIPGTMSMTVDAWMNVYYTFTATETGHVTVTIPTGFEFSYIVGDNFVYAKLGQTAFTFPVIADNTYLLCFYNGGMAEVTATSTATFEAGELTAEDYKGLIAGTYFVGDYIVGINATGSINIYNSDVTVDRYYTYNLVINADGTFTLIPAIDNDKLDWNTGDDVLAGATLTMTQGADGWTLTLNAGSTEPDEPDTPVLPDEPEVPATGALVVGKEYVLYLSQINVGKTLYFNGATESASVTYRLALSEMKADAVKVFVETVDGVAGAYRLYFYAGDVKTYIELSEYRDDDADPGYGSGTIKLVTSTDLYYTYDETAKTLVYTDAEGEDTYYLGTYADYTTISANNYSYIAGDKATNIGVTQFPAQFLAYDELGEDPIVPEEPDTPVVPDEPEVPGDETSEGYKLSATLDGTTYYFTGEIKSGKGVITTNAADAVVIYKEAATDGFYLYMMVDGAKQYLTVGTSTSGLGTSADPFLLNTYTSKDGSYSVIYSTETNRGFALYKGQDLRTYAVTQSGGAEATSNFTGTNAHFALVEA